MTNQFGQLLTRSTIADPGSGPPADPADIALQAQIDLARDRIRAGQPKTALTLLKELISAYWEGASARAKFRLLTNQGAAEYNLGNLTEAAGLLLKAEPFGGSDPLARANVVLALLLRDEVQEARQRADAILKDDPCNVFVAPLRVLTAFDEEGVDDPFGILPRSKRIMQRLSRLQRDGTGIVDTRQSADACLNAPTP